MSSRKILIPLLLISALTLIATQEDSETPMSAWKIPPKQLSLENGLTYIYQKDVSSAVTVVQVLIRAGKRDEPKGKEGLAYLTTRLAIAIPDQRKVQDLMDQATRLTMDSKSDYSFINISCLSENLDDSLETMTKIMRDPLFSGLKIDGIKKQMNRRRESAEDDSIQVAHDACFEIFFKDTPYGSSMFGTEESVKAIKKKDIENFYKSHFVARNMVVVCTSNLEEEEISKLVEKYFIKFPAGTLSEPEPLTINPPSEKSHSLERDTEQTLASYAFPLPRINARNLILAYMLENLLGKGFNSRLWPLRQKEKLAYLVNSRANQLKEGGFIEAYLETENSKKDLAMDALNKVLLELYEEGVSEKELQVTKTNSKANFLRNNETKNVRSITIAYFEALGVGYDFINRYFSEIDSTSLEEFNAYIKEVLNPEKGISIAVGPKGQ
ncbi:MAG: insulinase family protein [Candidatus Aminicenantes bacterium]|nr:insulinase family protein [Candidatus Aminicenantes bacterium]